MAEGYPVGNRAAPLLITLAATLPVVLLLSAMPNVGAAEQQPVMVGNGSLCSGVNGNGGGEDGGCLTIGETQPELEGFEMAMDLGSGVVFHRSLFDPSKVATGFVGNRKAFCGRAKDGRYIPCTTDARSGSGNKQKCDTFNRNNHCK